jgi:hypothetical protein
MVFETSSILLSIFPFQETLTLHNFVVFRMDTRRDGSSKFRTLNKSKLTLLIEELRKSDGLTFWF